MTLVEKRDCVNEYCASTTCGACKLRTGDWTLEISPERCLDICASPEEDLDRAIAIITREDVKVEVENDPVNRPSHYTAGGIECIDAIAASMTPDEYIGFLKGQVLKYVWRYRLKGKPAEDLKKARFDLDRLIQITEKEETV